MRKKCVMRHWLFVSLFTVLVQGSCSRGHDRLVVYPSVDKVLPLSAETFQIPPVLLYPKGIILQDSSLIVMNEQTDTLFQYFSRDVLAYRGQFGVKGQGPDDFVLPCLPPVRSGDDGFTLCDLNMLKRVKVGPDGFKVSTTRLPYDFRFYNGLLSLGDSVFCCHADVEDDHEFLLLSPGGKVEPFSAYPEEVAPRFKDVLARNQAYTSLTAVKPDGSRMAVFYQHVNRWRIFDGSGRMLSDNRMDDGSLSLPAVKDEERYIHTIQVFGTENHVYALNLDMNIEEIVNKAHTPTVRVFDWDGKPLREYSLDRFISSFAIDEASGCLYGVFAEDADHIYRFSLK